VSSQMIMLPDGRSFRKIGYSLALRSRAGAPRRRSRSGCGICGQLAPFASCPHIHSSGLAWALRLQQGGHSPEIVRWLDNGWWGHLHNQLFGNFGLADNTPYFLRAARRSLLRLQPGIGPLQSSAITLTAGWNFVALPPLTEPIHAEEARQQIAAQGGLAREIARWDAPSINWASHICDLSFGNFTLYPGRGYFIRITRITTPGVWRPQSTHLTTAPISPASDHRPLPAAKPATRVARVYDVRITDVRDGSFAVSWLTDAPAPGYLRYGAAPDALVNQVYDERGAATVSTTHRVTVAGLTANTTYYFTIEPQAPGATVQQVTTGPTLAIPAVDTIYGQTLHAGGAPVAGVLVYLELRESPTAGTSSGVLSALADADATGTSTWAAPARRMARATILIAAIAGCRYWRAARSPRKRDRRCRSKRGRRRRHSCCATRIASICR